MDGLTITLLSGLYASMFTLFYRIGRVEQEVKDLRCIIETSISGKHARMGRKE